MILLLLLLIIIITTVITTFIIVSCNSLNPSRTGVMITKCAGIGYSAICAAYTNKPHANTRRHVSA